MNESDPGSDEEATPEYRCQSCKEPISPDLDNIKSGWGKCPHCHNRHPQAVKMRAGTFGLFTILTILALLSVVGVVVAPITGGIAWYYYRKTQSMLEDDEYRIGEPVE